MKNQKGFSGLIVFLFIIIISLVGVVGWYVYNKQTTQSNKQVQANTSQNSTVQEPAKKNDESKTLKLAMGDKFFILKYPSGWTAETQKVAGYNEGTTVDNTILTSTGDTTVSLQGGRGGIGGACLPEDNNSQYILIQKAPMDIPEYTHVTYLESDLSSYISAVYSNESAARVKDGANTCDTAFSAFVLPTSAGMSIISIRSKSLDTVTQSGKSISLSDYQQWINSKEFSEAQKIVQSLSVE